MINSLKNIFYFLAKPGYDNNNDWKFLFYNCNKNLKGKYNYESHIYYYYMSNILLIKKNGK